MSESTSAPAAAPAEGGQTADATTVSPPPNSQPGISVSEAARLLNQQRKQGAPAPPPAARQAPPAPRPAPNAPAAPAAAAPAPAPPVADAGLSALDRALGVPGGVPPPAATPPAPSADASQALPGGLVEIEGQTLRTVADVQEFARRKTADYTQKMQALGERDRALRAQHDALATVLPYIQPELARLAEQVSNAPQRPDPAMLEVDPQGYLRARAAYENAMEEQNRLGSLTTLQQQAQARAMEQQVAAANEQLAQEFPFWADPAERGKAQQQIVQWATTKGGFSRDELRSLADPRQLKAMMKAMQFDRWVEGAKTSAPAQTTAAPARGQAPPAPPTAAIQVAQEAFERKPDFRTGAALLAARRAAAAR